MKHVWNYSKLIAIVCAFALLLIGCGEADPTDEAQNSVDESANPAISEVAPSGNEENPGRVMEIQRINSLPGTGWDGTGMVSFSEAPPVLDTKVNADEEEVIVDTKSLEDDVKTSGNGTPLVFSVADCTCIPLGTFDSAMEDQIITSINTYRKEGGLKLMDKNLSLSFCADVRAKEISMVFAHVRPNDSPWYTVAPAYCRGELLASEYDTAQDIVDAWMSSSVGRQYLLSNDLRSIGISVFITDKDRFIAATIGI